MRKKVKYTIYIDAIASESLIKYKVCKNKNTTNLRSQRVSVRRVKLYVEKVKNKI